MFYTQIQTIFQDKYETGLKNAGLQEYKLPSEVIFNYIHEAEVEVADELARGKQFLFLKNLITTSPIDSLAENAEASNLYTVSQPSDFLNYVRSITSGTFSTMYTVDTAGVVSNEFIEPYQAGMFYKTPFNQVPLFRNPKVFFQTDNTDPFKKMYLIMPSGSTPLRVDLTYVKVPPVPEEDGQTLIDESFINKMIELAVQKALQYVMAGGAQKSDKQSNN